MSTFEITTHSIFENKYLVEASSFEEAANLVLDLENTDIPFIQKHVREQVLQYLPLDTKPQWEEWVRKWEKSNFTA